MLECICYCIIWHILALIFVCCPEILGSLGDLCIPIVLHLQSKIFMFLDELIYFVGLGL